MQLTRLAAEYSAAQTAQQTRKLLVRGLLRRRLPVFILLVAQRLGGLLCRVSLRRFAVRVPRLRPLRMLPVSLLLSS